MNDWRDDLPPIPSERIRAAAIREGDRRREARYQRQRAVLYGGMGVGAVGLIVAFGALVLISAGGDDDDDVLSGATDNATETLAGGTSGATEATTGDTGGTEAPPTTGAAAGTEAPVTEPEATTAPVVGPTIGPVPDAFGGLAGGASDYTTVGGPIAALPPSPAVEVPIEQVWEETCDESLLVIRFTPEGLMPITPVIHWEAAGRRGEGPMFLRDGRAEVAIGPFPGDMLEGDAATEVLLFITDAEAAGNQIFRAPTVILNGC